MKKQYRVQDTTTDAPQACELKADGEARPRNDGTEPMRFTSLRKAETAAKDLAGMDVVDNYEGV